jgi:transposase
MKTMFEYDLVRRLHFREGLSRHEISRRTGLHRQTINKMLRYSRPPGYRLSRPRSRPKLDQFGPLIDQMLEEDRLAPSKQRHTAQRILRRLKEEHGFGGSYTIVKDYVREQRLRLREVFFPLEQRPGTSQVDFGRATVVLGGREQTAYVFCMALPYSDAVFVKAYPTEALEAVQDGHNEAYAFFAGVPPWCLYDNMSTAVKVVARGKTRELTDGFLALRSHYLFTSQFCNVGRANEKGVVERLVGYVRRNFLVPIPRYQGWDDLNSYLLDQCRRRLSMTVAGKKQTIGALLQEERGGFLPLPHVVFEAARVEPRRVTSLSLVRFQGNSYSVPVDYAYREVTVKAYVNHLTIGHREAMIARHERCYGRDEFVLNPVHYLSLLERKPGALDGARPFTAWPLPGCFETLRRYLEARSGPAGIREYILILQLLRDFSTSDVRRAIEKALQYGAVTFESIKMLALSGREPSFEAVRLSAECLAGLPKVYIAGADPSCYRALLAAGGVS